MIDDAIRPNSLRNGPDEQGRFGQFGGRFVAETLMPLILDLEKAYRAAQADPAYVEEVRFLGEHYTGRPSPLYFAERLTEHLGGAKVYFKREELNHTGSHKLNNCIGQILLAKRMGKTRIIAETGAGQHGVATATVCARFGLPCTIFMGATDVARQRPNVWRMKMLGAEVRAVTAGAGTLKDAMNEALRDWVTNVEDTYYLIGTAAGPHPYPEMVRDFQSVVGTEIKAQMLVAEGKLPDALVACVGGGSNAIGTFHPFLDDTSVKIYGAEAGGHGIDIENGHASSMTGGRPGVLHGNRTYLLQNGDGQILEGHSISPASTIRASARSTPSCTIAAALPTRRSPTRKRWPRSSFARGSRASFRRWKRRMAWRCCKRSRRPCARTRPLCCVSRVAAIRTWNRSASISGWRCNEYPYC